MPSTIYRPGQRVPVSGIYNVVNAYGTYMGRQDTCEEGETFPPTISPSEYGYVLAQETIHRRA
jgi:hypothetical protein